MTTGVERKNRNSINVIFYLECGRLDIIKLLLIEFLRRICHLNYEIRTDKI